MVALIRVGKGQDPSLKFWGNVVLGPKGLLTLRGCGLFASENHVMENMLKTFLMLILFLFSAKLKNMIYNERIPFFSYKEDDHSFACCSLVFET